MPVGAKSLPPLGMTRYSVLPVLTPDQSAAWDRKAVAAGIELVGADVVEVIPTAVGSADVTALVAERTVREVMTGIALARAEE